jgi:WhiB family transcriptional regulator, redox-sensing transcriptional regulator
MTARHPGPWVMRAKRRQSEPDLFFPEKGLSSRPAIMVCLGCPVRQECLDHALEHDERFGIWGGMTETERRRMKPGDGARPSTAASTVTISPRSESIPVAGAISNALATGCNATNQRRREKTAS